ncbi:MAG: hypothetical protein Q4C65_13210, partial [Eubacteriales bacterium]|nr:hypothetical protein [Eubacteriales bacterium]
MTGKKSEIKTGGLRQLPIAWALPVLFFAGLWLFGSTGVYNDSNQYIAMHIHREPLYPFFLWICRSLFGEGEAGTSITPYLEAARFLQNVLAAFSVLWLAQALRSRFCLGQWMNLAVCLLLLAPHVITPVFASSRLVLSNGIVSEALGLPLFYLFTAQCLKMLADRTRRAAWSSLLLALFLSLVRGQMMFAILLWFVTASALIIGKVASGEATDRPSGSLSGRPWRILRQTGARLLACLLCVALAFGARGLLVRSYNLAFNGFFINNTFGGVGLLANVLYAADREDGERIQDETAREFFYLSYDMAWEQGANWRFSPEGFLNRAAHLEKWHDALKFDFIEEPWRLVHDGQGFTEYIPENVESDRIAGRITGALLPAVFGRWLYDYLALSACGLIRSVAVVHPVLNWYALAAYLGYIALLFYTRRKNPASLAVRFGAFSLLAVAANVYATSLLIMCLSRYMIYGLPLFYVGG